MRTICLDFDGVIHMFTTPFTSARTIPDAPVPGAFDAIRMYLDAGFSVVVCSRRAHWLAGPQAMRDWFRLRCASDILSNQNFVITDTKPHAEIYVDDRGWRFEGNNFPSLEDIRDFRPWNKRNK